MMVAGIHTDLRVRRLLRDRLEEEDLRERARLDQVDRNQRISFSPPRRKRISDPADRRGPAVRCPGRGRRKVETRRRGPGRVVRPSSSFRVAGGGGCSNTGRRLMSRSFRWLAEWGSGGRARRRMRTRFGDGAAGPGPRRRSRGRHEPSGCCRRSHRSRCAEHHDRPRRPLRLRRGALRGVCGDGPERLGRHLVSRHLQDRRRLGGPRRSRSISSETISGPPRSWVG